MNNTRLQGRARSLARGIFWPLAGLLIALAVAGYSIYISRDGRVICTSSEIECQVRLQFSSAQAADFEQRGVALQTMLAFRFSALLLGNLASLVIGLFIAFRKSDDWMALSVALFLIISGTVANGGVMSALTRAVPALNILMTVFYLLFINLLFLVFALFPNGRFAPHWMGKVLPLLCILISIITLLPGNTSGLAGVLATALTFIGFSTLILAQVIRFRRYSTPLERQQTKWAVTGIVAYLIVFLSTALLASSKPLGENRLFDSLVGTLGFNLLPGLLIAGFLGIAILRSHLWDIDIIIRKSLVWGALTILLGLIFFGGVTMLQSTFSAISKNLNFVQAQSPFSIVLSTLAIAALFNPLRKRVQDFVDWRFYRRKYNAEQALASFSALARQEVDLEEIGARLLGVVEETVQPESVSLWLRPTEERRQ